MKMVLKKKLLIILFSIIALNLFTLTGFITEKKSSANNYNNLWRQQLMLKLNNGAIALSADLDNEHQVFGNFKLKIGNSERSYNWRSLGGTSHAPTINTIDLGSNNNAGVVVFLVDALGTGVFIQNVHVIKIDSYSEIPVENPLVIIQKNVKTQSSNNSIIIDINGNKTVLDKSYLNSLGINNLNQKLIYEYRIVYGTKNNNLFAEVGVSNENLTYLGTIHIDYTYKDEMLTMNNITFQKFN